MRTEGAMTPKDASGADKVNSGSTSGMTRVVDRPGLTSRAPQWMRVWRGLGPSGWLSLGVVIVMAIAALWPRLLTRQDPNAVDAINAFAAPSLTAPLGTDASGRDVLTRVIYGASESLGIAMSATGIGLAAAIVLGFPAALGPRWVDGVLSRVIEVLFALPSLVLALLLVAVLGAGVWASVIAVGVSTAPGYARILRSRARTVALSGYVDAARLEGRGPWSVFTRHILPNTMWPLIAVATLGIGQAIVWVSALSYLGLGALPPSPEWGAMLNGGRIYIASAWWLTVAPGLAITLAATATTILGRKLSAVNR